MACHLPAWPPVGTTGASLMASSSTVAAWFLATAHFDATAAGQSAMGLRLCSTSQCWLSIIMWNMNLQLRRIAIQKWRQQRPRICSVRSLCVASIAFVLVFMPGCIPPLVGLSFLCFYAVASSLSLVFGRFCLCLLLILFIATMYFAGYFLVRFLLLVFPAYLRTYFQFDIGTVYLVTTAGLVADQSM